MTVLKIQAQPTPSEVFSLSQTRHRLLASRDALGREQAALIARTRSLSQEIDRLSSVESALALREANFAVKHDSLLRLARATETGVGPDQASQRARLHGIQSLVRRLARKVASAKAAKLAHRAQRMSLRVQLRQAVRELKTMQTELGLLLAQLSANRRALSQRRARPGVGDFRNGSACPRVRLGVTTSLSGQANSLERAPAVRLQNLVGSFASIP